MKAPALKSLALHWHGTQLKIIDQTRLPQEEVWLSLETFEQMVEAIQALRVRGAPLIGVAAAASYAQQVLKDQPQSALAKGAQDLIEARPTAVNLAMAVSCCLKAKDPVAEAIRLFEEDQTCCEKIATAGAPLLKNLKSVMTYCNAGALATAGIGTALGVISRAAKQNPSLHVYTPETRPLFQGARLTEWELERNQIPHTLVCDNMVATLMSAGKVEAVIVGADRIAKNGDFANKIGTYGLAVLAKHHGIPFYVAAPFTTCDNSCATGKDIPVEERQASEVRFPKARNNAPIFNPAFDVTPAELVTQFILDSGLVKPHDLADRIAPPLS